MTLAGVRFWAEGNPSVEVSYTTTLDDYVAFSVHAFKRSPSMRLRLALAWAVVPLVCWLAAALISGRDAKLAMLVAAGGVVYAVIYPLIQNASLGASVRAYARDLDARGVIGRITLVLEEETLTEITE